MPVVTIDGKETEFSPGESVIQVAERTGAEIPHYCWHSELPVAANCRMCLVEVEKAPKLLPGCQTECRDGMVVYTKSERVREAQRAVQEFLLLNHPIDCPICDQAGECRLQDYYMEYDHTVSRMKDDKVGKPRLDRLGPYVVYNAERCILCTRCVRFMEHVAGDRQLGIVGRGNHAYIATFPGRTLDNPYSMNVVDLCPVGALTSTIFRFKQRVWNLRRTPSLCPGCARGCNIHVDQRSGLVYRLLPRRNDEVNKCWMCDEGRLCFSQANEARLTQGLLRGGAENIAEAVPTAEAFDKAVALLKPIAAAKKGLGIAISLRATCEDAYVLGRLAADVLGADCVSLLGEAEGPGDELLRLADRNPNRDGLQRVLAAAGVAFVGRGELEERVRNGQIKAVLCVGHEMERVESLAELLGSLEVFVHVASVRTALAERAHVTLPTVSWVQSDGTWVNAQQRAQRLMPAFGPQGDQRESYRWLMDISARLDVPFTWQSSQAIRAEIERLVEGFPEGSLCDLGPQGRSLASG